MIRKTRIDKASYREDYNVLVLEVTFPDNGETKTLVMDAGETTTNIATKNCKKIEGKTISMEMTSNVQSYDMKALEKLTTGQFSAIMENERQKMTHYPYGAAVQILKERHPEDFPGNSDSDNIAAWYSFPKETYEEQNESEQSTDKSG